jgi:hypothetical protein
LSYFNSYNYLKKLYNPGCSSIQVPESGIEIYNIDFSSGSWTLLPGASEYFCSSHKARFEEEFICKDQPMYQNYPAILKHHDSDIEENKNFKYLLFKKSGIRKADEIILLFHGLNEKSWHKYLPWAEKLVTLTGKAVLLFPIAFHMNRVPAEWGNPRLMKTVTDIRQAHSYPITNSTFANAAMSARLQSIPQRFLWSGLQTYYDVLKLIDDIRGDKNQFISADSSIDLFAYSIGSFLSEILIMTNAKGYFNQSKLFMFCGGSTLDRMSPNSKFILDSDATIALYSFYTERLESELKFDKRLAHYFNDHEVGKYFSAMLSYKKNKKLREMKFRELNKKIKAVTLEKDEVIPPNEILNTLTGDYRNIAVEVDIIDFPYAYDHVTPFPSIQELETEVDKAFNKIFTNASEFYTE